MPVALLECQAHLPEKSVYWLDICWIGTRMYRMVVSDTICFSFFCHKNNWKLMHFNNSVLQSKKTVEHSEGKYLKALDLIVII